LGVYGRTYERLILTYIREGFAVLVEHEATNEVSNDPEVVF